MPLTFCEEYATMKVENIADGRGNDSPESASPSELWSSGTRLAGERRAVWNTQDIENG